MVAALVDKCREEVVLVRKKTLGASIFVSVLSLWEMVGFEEVRRQVVYVPFRRTLICSTARDAKRWRRKAARLTAERIFQAERTNSERESSESSYC